MKKSALSRLQALLPQPRKKARRLAADAARQLTAPFDDHEGEPTTRLSTAFGVVLMLHLVAVGGVYAFHCIKKSRNAAVVAATPDLMSEIKRTAPNAAVVQKPSAAALNAPSSVGVVSPQKVQQTMPSSAVPVAASAVSVSSTASGISASRAAVGGAQVSKSGGAAKPEPSGPSAVVTSAKAPATASVVALPVSVSATPVGVGGAVSNGGASSGDGGSGTTRTHTVQKGENPVTIAKRFGVSQEELLKLNSIEDPRKLRIGQILRIPVKKGTP